MAKRMLLMLPFGLSLLLVCGQVKYSNYHVIINYATAPGPMSLNSRFFKFSTDTLVVIDGGRRYFMSPKKDHYDTSYYLLTPMEKYCIISAIGPDTLIDAINPCIMDGLIFFVSYGFDSSDHLVIVSNAYNEKIFQLIEIVNNHVPEEIRIRYDKERMLAEMKKCDERLSNRN